MSLLIIVALSFFYLTIVKKDMSSAKSFMLDFNSFGKSLMKMTKRSGLQNRSLGDTC